MFFDSLKKFINFGQFFGVFIDSWKSGMGSLKPAKVMAMYKGVKAFESMQDWLREVDYNLDKLPWKN